MTQVETTLYILRGLSAILGGTFFFVTFRAYLRSRAPSMGTLALATALLTIGTITEGIIIQLFPGDLDLAHILESIVFLAAFGVLLASVLVHRPRHRVQKAEPEESS